MPQSPHRPSSEELSGGLSAVLHSKEAFCAPVPLHPQVPLSTSPRPSLIASTMATAFQDHALSKEPRSSAFTDLTDPHAMQWSMNSDAPASHIAQEGSGYSLPLQYMPESTGFYSYPHNGLPYNENYNLTYSAPFPGSSCPRSYTNGLDLTGLPMGMPDAYPPAAYQIEPQRPHEAVEMSEGALNGQLMQLREEYDNQYGANIKVEEHGGYTSPYDSDVTRSSTPSGDPPMPPHDYKPDGTEEGVIDKEQPYAQLIYRALREAKGHTMILRDIYDWFKKNTDKAADKETKGWQNSIRHNLSMNGAFEKVDQPCEEAKKGFMWRLTEEALREGVKSTTRYRSKQPNKRGHRSQQPLPQRQASGAKGGQAAKRSARMRRTNRGTELYRSEPYMSRSVPAGFDSFIAEATMPYPASPFYGSVEDFDYPSPDDSGNPLGGHGLGLFPPTRSYTGSPLSREMTACGDTAYILPHDPSEPLFTNSPSPTADEPRTPVSQNGSWEEPMALGEGMPYVFETSYTEFAG